MLPNAPNPRTRHSRTDPDRLTRVWGCGARRMVASPDQSVVSVPSVSSRTAERTWFECDLLARDADAANAYDTAGYLAKLPSDSTPGVTLDCRSESMRIPGAATIDGFLRGASSRSWAARCWVRSPAHSPHAPRSSWHDARSVGSPRHTDEPPSHLRAGGPALSPLWCADRTHRATHRAEQAPDILLPQMPAVAACYQ